jgi:cytochrome c553
LKYILLLITIFTFGFTNTTLCFKNGHADFATIEEQKFDGGECKGENSINEMKTKGWEVSDIKMLQKDEGYNFVYILKKDMVKSNISSSTIVTPVTNKGIDYKQLALAVDKQKEENKKEEELQIGERMYKKQCQSCHGKFGELEPNNTSRPINNMSFDNFDDIMYGYKRNDKDYDRGFAPIMAPYASLVSPTDVKNIYKYLEKINKK